MRRYPDFDARPCLARVAAKVHLVHGFGDQLVPFTETLRLASAFPPDRPARATISPLFGHAPRQSHGARPRLSPSSYLAELVRLARALNDLAGAV
jgi:fermentation-respiration switch protein FrsA (DUF1100 family)